MNSKSVGNIAESKFILECAKRNITVALPFGDNARYDAVIDLPDLGLKRVQVKTLRKLEEGKYDFATRSNSVKGAARVDYTDQVDYFFAYNLEDDVWVFVPMSLVGTKYQVVVRSTPPRNNQKVGINMIIDYNKF